MALSGQFTNNFHTGYSLKITWNINNQSIDSNTSTVTAAVQLISSGSAYSINSSVTKNGSLTINGNTYNFTFLASLSGGQTKTLFTKTITVQHGADGSKTCNFSASAALNVTLSDDYISTVTVSGSGVFEEIPRATMPSLSAATVVLGSTVKITTNAASSNFTHTLKYSIAGEQSGIIQENVKTSYTWTVPKTIANAFINSTSGKVVITCNTYNGSRFIGSQAVGLNITIPNTTEFQPTVSATASEGTAGIAAQFNAFVQGQSKINFAITAAGVYGSTITDYSTVINGVTYRGNAFSIDKPDFSGSITVISTVTDSRGRSKAFSQSINILSYENIKIGEFGAYRANTEGIEDDEGTRLLISAQYDISPLNNLNLKKPTLISYREQGAESWTTLKAISGDYSYDQSFLSDAVFDVEKAYELNINIQDFFNEVSVIINIPTAVAPIDINASGKGIAFGKISEKDQMEIAFDVDLIGKLLQEDKQAPTLLNGWTNFSADGGIYEPAGYWKDKNDVVHLSGIIKGGTVTAGTALFVLPEGYRPNKQEMFATASYNAFCRVDVAINGSVYVQYGGNTNWLSLCGINFKAKE